MLKAKVADTPHAIERGLMFVKDMPSDEGMLFIFGRAKPLSFWGKNTFIPLDIAFVDDRNTIRKISKIKPFCTDPISCQDKCIMAIEANDGYFAGEGISVGDTIEIDRPTFRDDAHITFRKIKDSSVNLGKTKQSQMMNGLPSVPKPGEETVGDPIAVQTEPQDQMAAQNLPVLGPADIGQYIEDGFDEEEQDVQDGLDGDVDQPQPQDVPEEQPTGDDKYPVFDNAFDASDWAQQNNEVIRINYTTKHGRALVRDVEPHGTFHSQSTNRELMVTYDETVDGIRAFIISNIGNWAFVGRKFQPKFVVKA